MMSLQAIRALSAEQAERAAEEELTPFVPFNVEEVESWDRFPFPNIGDYTPPGWERVEGAEWFVDKTGWGSEGEPALTVRGFQAALVEYVRENPRHGYAITEEGQFQVYVTAFRKAVAA